MANSLMEAKCNAITNLKESRLGTVREKGIHNIKQKKKIVKKKFHLVTQVPVIVQVLTPEFFAYQLPVSAKTSNKLFCVR